MSDPKPFASLSSGLLARKGAAKPAMRPQGYGHMPSTSDDLGWNDMGHYSQEEVYELDAPMEHVPSSIAALTPAPGDARNPSPVEAPPVVEQQRALEEHFDAEPTPPATVAAVTPPAPQIKARAKTAFTLRLDPDRHLKLRLACAVAGRSAQQIVTGALDAYLGSLPQIESLARQIPDASGPPGQSE